MNQVNLRLRGCFYNKDSPMESKDNVSNPNSQGGSGGISTFEWSICTTCENQHLVSVLPKQIAIFSVWKEGS